MHWGSWGCWKGQVEGTKSVITACALQGDGEGAAGLTCSTGLLLLFRTFCKDLAEFLQTACLSQEFQLRGCKGAGITHLQAPVVAVTSISISLPWLHC